MASFIGLLQRLWTVDHPPEPPKSADAIRIGLFGASWIAPTAVIIPAKSHPGVIIAAVAARDRKRGEAYAKKHKIPLVHGSYQEMLDDPAIDAVYIPLPNGLHYEWAMKALRAGKHVLLEKPSSSNSTEAASLFDYHASLPKPAPVILEAFHYRFHPAWQTFLSFLDPPNIMSAHSSFSSPAGFIPKDDIRFIYSLSGGTLMDMGTYTVSTLRQAFGAEPVECVSATARLVPTGHDQKCDEGFKGTWRFPNGGIGSIAADLRKKAYGLPAVETPSLEVKHKEVLISVYRGGPFLKEGQKHFNTRTATMWNFVLPTYWHRIDLVDEHAIKDSDGKIVKTWTEKQSTKAYTWSNLGREGTVRVGEDYWSTYRFQLEEFVNKIKGRAGSGVWVDGQDSIAQMKAIDSGYEKAGLPIRPTSSFLTNS